MGQKVHPTGLRIGIIQDWKSRWFAKDSKKFAKYLDGDIKIRRYLGKRLARAGIARIEIERADKSVSIFIFTARPGIVIGKGGTEVDQIRGDIERIAGTKDVQISVLEVRFPELDANLVSQNIAEQMVARVPFRRAMKRAVSAAMKTGAEGVKVMVSGRLGGHEMARTEWYREGRVPLHTLRADIDYGFAIARTTFGSIGVKTWIYKGEKSGKYDLKEEEPLGLAKPKTKSNELGLITTKKPEKPKVEVKEEKQKDVLVTEKEEKVETKAAKEVKETAKEELKEGKEKETKASKTKNKKAADKEVEKKKETKSAKKAEEKKEEGKEVKKETKAKAEDKKKEEKADKSKKDKEGS